MIRNVKDNLHEFSLELAISEYFPNCVTVECSLTQELLDLNPNFKGKDNSSTHKHDLLLINGQDDFITIYPINTRFNHYDYFTNKYSQIESITLEGFDFITPESVDAVLELLDDLPSGFVKDYNYGLGLAKDYRFIIHAIEEIKNIKHLVISKNESTGVIDDTFMLHYSEFEGIRKGINRIATNHQSLGRVEKDIFSYNSILSKFDSITYPEKKFPYQQNSIYKLVSSTTCSALSNSDTETVVDLITSNKESVYQNNRKKIMQLHDGIDLLNFKWLIGEVDRLLKKNSSENDWQKLLNENPIILSLIFGYPVIKIQEQASIGGRKLSGSGDKITDFLVKNNLTNNCALIEIKKPSTLLLRKSEYRGGVYAPSNELCGSISQLLDQQYKFHKEIATLKDNSGIYDIESYSVDCVLIIGEMPKTKEQKKSFELFRYNLKNIKVYTFDELATKLKNIYSILTP